MEREILLCSVWELHVVLTTLALVTTLATLHTLETALGASFLTGNINDAVELVQRFETLSSPSLLTRDGNNCATMLPD